MADSQATTVSNESSGKTVGVKGALQNDTTSDIRHKPVLELSHLPSVFVLPTHLHEDEIHDLEDSLAAANARVTHDPVEAEIFLGSVESKRRARYELQIRGLSIETFDDAAEIHSKGDTRDDAPRPKKRQNIGTKGSDSGFSLVEESSSMKTETDSRNSHESRIVRVINQKWLKQSLDEGAPAAMQGFLVYEGIVSQAAKQSKAALPFERLHRPNHSERKPTSALPNRTERPNLSLQATGSRPLREGKRDRNAEAIATQLSGKTFMPSDHGSSSKRSLISETTSEHECTTAPEIPDWVRQNKIYACERFAPIKSPNEGFIAQLEKIRLARTLTGDEIGVRAYSTSIASIAAYADELVSHKEVLALPGCNEKIAALFQEYRDYGRLKAADEADKDPALSVIHDFYKIWGVGAATAREFYNDRGWRDRDDIIEFGWNTLSRHQQIGVKFFDEFEVKMTRKEVEHIAFVVTSCARRLCDEEIQCAIVGGYRRGNKEASDVDLVLSHPDDRKTRFLINPLVRSLEEDGWITHTLILAETTSNREQETLPLKSVQKTSGFDTLDKALVVWQDPRWVTKDIDLARNPNARNPNIHRRVDIIIAPWRVVGCAVAGWTSGTTFQRDLRRYARKVKGWKFDSSGVRDLGSGRWLDLESWRNVETRAKTWQEAEKRVFEGLGLPWIPPEQRNTG